MSEFYGILLHKQRVELVRRFMLGLLGHLVACKTYVAEVARERTEPVEVLDSDVLIQLPFARPQSRLRQMEPAFFGVPLVPQQHSSTEIGPGLCRRPKLVQPL